VFVNKSCTQPTFDFETKEAAKLRSEGGVKIVQASRLRDHLIITEGFLFGILDPPPPIVRTRMILSTPPPLKSYVRFRGTKKRKIT